MKNIYKNKKILSSKEEATLSREEYDDYLRNLKKYCSNRKLRVTTPGGISLAPKLKPCVNVISNIVTKILAGGTYEKVIEGIENISDGPVIFASSHQGIMDNFVWFPDNPKHALIVHGLETNKLLLYAQYDIGLILVTKDKRKSQKRLEAKLDMISVLLKGHSIMIFPETTWNLSPNKLHLPINYGFIDVAKKANVPIIPMVIEYTYDTKKDKERISKIHIRYEKPIRVSKEDSLITKVQEYSATISTMRWEMLEKKGMEHRKNIDNWEYINFLKGNYHNLELGKKDRIMENKGIHGSSDEFYNFFYINDHNFDKVGNLIPKQSFKNVYG